MKDTDRYREMEIKLYDWQTVNGEEGELKPNSRLLSWATLIEGIQK